MICGVFEMVFLKFELCQNVLVSKDSTGRRVISDSKSKLELQIEIYMYHYKFH